jgi:hypothetical protein
MGVIMVFVLHEIGDGDRIKALQIISLLILIRKTSIFEKAKRLDILHTVMNNVLQIMKQDMSLFFVFVFLFSLIFFLFVF